MWKNYLIKGNNKVLKYYFERVNKCQSHSITSETENIDHRLQLFAIKIQLLSIKLVFL